MAYWDYTKRQLLAHRVERLMTDDKSLLFRVSNKHVPDSGTPPQFDGDTQNRYYGYFQNTFGEQLIFEYDHVSKQARLWHGDAGWDKPYPVVNENVSGLILSEGEQLWLRACWLEATGQ